jgi:cytochrome c biogenesis protein CcmG/thiol:disulfide interchange protein DsbE
MSKLGGSMKLYWLRHRAIRAWLSAIAAAQFLLFPWAPDAVSAEFGIDQYSGKVVVLDFWASWCVPCRQSFPWMNTMHRQYGRDGLEIIAVNMDQVHADAEAFLSKYPAEFKVHYDPDGKLAPQFKVRGMPTSALLGRDGKVLLIHEGFKSKDAATLEQAIRDALR